MLLVWTENLSVKIKELDDDHKKLIKVINELHHAIADAGDAGKIEAVEIEIALHRLQNYAKIHFEREEGILAAAGHGDLEAQHEAHRRMFEAIAEMSIRFRDSTRLQDASELMNFIYEWLTNHVYVSDQKWAKDLQASKTLGERPNRSGSGLPTADPRIGRSREQKLESPRTTILG